MRGPPSSATLRRPNRLAVSLTPLAPSKARELLLLHPEPNIPEAPFNYPALVRPPYLPPPKRTRKFIDDDLDNHDDHDDNDEGEHPKDAEHNEKHQTEHFFINSVALSDVVATARAASVVVFNAPAP